jgi:hypothetical protein
LLPFGCYQACSECRLHVEHPACTSSSSLVRADRPPPAPSSHQRPCLACVDSLAQSYPLFLSDSPWPHSPCSAARQRTPRPRSPGHLPDISYGPPLSIPTAPLPPHSGNPSDPALPLRVPSILRFRPEHHRGYLIVDRVLADDPSPSFSL